MLRSRALALAALVLVGACGDNGPDNGGGDPDAGADARPMPTDLRPLPPDLAGIPLSREEFARSVAHLYRGYEAATLQRSR